MKIAHLQKGISLSQGKYTLELIANVGLLTAKLASFLMDTYFKLCKEDGEMVSEVFAYRRLIGRLLYLTHTRHDNIYSVHHLNQFLDSPHVLHIQIALRVFIYLKSAFSQGLFFLPSSSVHHVKGFSYSYWVNFPDPH